MPTPLKMVKIASTFHNIHQAKILLFLRYISYGRERKRHIETKLYEVLLLGIPNKLDTSLANLQF